MAVYTKLSESEIANIVSNYNIGRLISFKGIEQGIENSNYLIVTEQAKFILTIFEQRVKVDEIPFFIALTSHLKRAGINCPDTVVDKQGHKIQDIRGKKAVLISFLEGQGVEKIEDIHIQKLGEKVAKMHVAVGDFILTRANDMALTKWVKLFESVAPMVDEIKPGLQKFIGDKIYELAAKWPFGLPSGIIHADIFPDNVFFEENEISGVIDFYFACSDQFAYDIAIIFNAWGIETDTRRQKIFLDSYNNVRQLSAEEMAALPTLLQGAALRFLMTRLYDWFNTPKDAVVKKKDPMEYVRKLEALSK